MQPVFLVGPTAVGKSAVALELAQLIGAEIISADSMQVYRGMDIGTAKPTADERRQVPHHLIDVNDVSEPFDVKRFVELASVVIADLISKGRLPLIVGGTGLYVRGLRQGLFEGPGRNIELRRRLEATPTPELFAELQRVDPATAAQIDGHNPRRLVRALEVFYDTGKSIRQLQTEWAGASPNPAPLIGLERPRPELIQRIDQRIDAQIAAGWVAEVRQLMAHGLEQNPGALQAAGYRELAAHVRGELPLADAVTLIKTRTRQLAKRQMTWFRREAGVSWIMVKADESPVETARAIDKFLKESEANH